MQTPFPVEYRLRWVPGANPFFGGIWALVDIVYVNCQLNNQVEATTEKTGHGERTGQTVISGH